MEQQIKYFVAKNDEELNIIVNSYQQSGLYGCECIIYNYMLNILDKAALQAYKDEITKCQSIIVKWVQFANGKKSAQKFLVDIIQACVEKNKEIILIGDRDECQIELLKIL